MRQRGQWVILCIVIGVVLAAGIMLGYALSANDARVLPNTADGWAALGTVGTFFIAAGAAAIAFTQLAEARRLRIEQAQPYVVAYMEQNPNIPILVELVIRNFGTTAARNIEITSSPTIQRTDGDRTEDVWLPSEISILAPQQEWRTYWDSGAERPTHSVLADVNRHVVTLKYDGVKGTSRQESESIIDWSAYTGRLYLDRKSVHHVAKSLKTIEDLMRKWTESGHGLSVYTRDGEAKDARVAAIMEERAQKHQELKDRLLPKEDPAPTGLPEDD